MKRETFLAATFAFVITSVVSLDVTAADETGLKKEGAASENVRPKTMKKHSHLEEKGIPSADPTSTGKPAKADERSTDKDTKKHVHSRDAK
jgi:hypothetical protein